MVGFVAAVGLPADGFEPVLDRLSLTGRERTAVRTVGDLTVATAFHASVAESQPATANDGTCLFVWGAPTGIFGPDGYEPRSAPPHEAPAAYCAAQYDRFGPSFVDRLNGSFVGVAYDPDGTCLVFTDRLGTRPLYRWHTDGGAAVFATGLQQLTAHPAVTTNFDAGGLGQYFALSRIPGTRTPLAGVTVLPPATVGTLASDDEFDQRCYWRPVVERTDASFDELVGRFQRTLRTVLDEQVAPNGDYDLLLSGGFDSRLLLGELAGRTNLTAYHMADWVSPEARAAQRSAAAEDVPFELIERDVGFHREKLRQATRVMSDYGTFDQAHAVTFDDTLGTNGSVVVSGLYANVLFEGDLLETRSLSLLPSLDVGIPVERQVSSIADYLDGLSTDAPAYFTGPPPERTLAAATGWRGETVDHQGVQYPSLRELVCYGELYPLSNDPDLFYYSLLQTAPHFTPFLDARLVDLALRVPIDKQLLDNVVAGALRRGDPELASIPRQHSNVRPKDAFPRNYLRRNLTLLGRRLGFEFGDTPPREWHGRGPWTNHETLVRSHPFVIETLFDHRERIESLPFLDWEGAIDCYMDHLGGADNSRELYGLLSFLEMPMVDDLLDRGFELRSADEVAVLGSNGGRERGGRTMSERDGRPDGGSDPDRPDRPEPTTPHRDRWEST